MKRVVLLAVAAAILLSACSALPSEMTPPPGMGRASLYPAPGDNGTANYYPAEAPQQNVERYLEIEENRTVSTERESVQTISLKVDTAAYSNVERYISSGALPPKDAVRTEELINYFSYENELSFGDGPFAVSCEVAPSPYDSGKMLAAVRVATKKIDKSALPSSNLVFLVDTSGSMDSYDKLPLLVDALSLLTDTLDGDDRVSIVTYAGSSGVLLDSASGDDREKIKGALSKLSAGGSTAGAAGISTAYDIAARNFMRNGNNRVILATDGDFNVGINSVEELESFISEKRDSGVYLSILGFGTENIRDDIMETLSKHGSGNYSYINSLATAKKVLVEELAANLYTVADDVKAQIEFNPAVVSSFRMIGYENRIMDNKDFKDDAKDAGEIGAGADVMVLYELQLHGVSSDVERKYTTPALGAAEGELFEVRIRYKNPGESEAMQENFPFRRESVSAAPSSDLGYASAVAGFAELLRGSRALGNIDMQKVRALAAGNQARDESGYRREFIKLVEKAARLMP